MSANPHVLKRLQGIQQQLFGVHKGGSGLSSATKGGEREQFIDAFLSQVLPPNYRFGTGDATDQTGTKSGQLDVVIEFPRLPSLPLVGGEKSRLYLAEGIVAVIEVKSNVAGQWAEVLSTAGHLSKLSRNFGTQMSFGQSAHPSRRIPLFVAGYTGWRQVKTVQDKLNDSPVDGILVIDPGIFVSTNQFGGIEAGGAWSLWGFISCLYKAIGPLMSTSIEPMNYAT